MTRTRPTTAALLALTALAGACVTTPLPLPPTMDPDRLALDGGLGDTVVVTGAAGAVDPGGIRLRVTAVEGPTWGVPADFGETDVAADGSFSVVVAGSLTDFFYFEEVRDDEDVFLLAVSLAYGDVSEVDPGPDRDGDGSPDAIDCAPDDETLGGRRCP